MDDTKKSSPIFSIIFNDGSHFTGGTNYFDTKWLEIPNKKIKRIFYKLPTDDYICLDGYDKYFHMVEALKDITGIDRGIIKLQYVYIMGKKNDEVTSYRITLFNDKNDKFRIGDITVRKFNILDSKIKKLNSDNWR